MNQIPAYLAAIVRAGERRRANTKGPTAMGVDTKIMLPGNVRVSDVAKVIGVLHGCEVKLKPLGRDALVADVAGVRVEGITTLPVCCTIFITGGKVGGDRQFLYHFEPDHGGRLLMPRSTPLNIVLGVRLVDFFGGTVDFNDCDDEYADYARPPRCDAENAPTDGVEWDDFQRRIARLAPITREELASYAEHAAYPVECVFA